MFQKIKSFFKGEKSLVSSLHEDSQGAVADGDLHVAAAVLLIEMAGTDSGIDPKEAATVCATLQNEFRLAEESLPELVQTAIAARQTKGKIDEFVGLINERFNDAQRQRLFGMIWKVVIADGKIDRFEQRFAVQMQYRLKLTDEQALNARGMAENGEVR